MNTAPQAQERSWFFCIDSPCHVRSLLPVPKSSEEDASAMPVVLVADRKTGNVKTYDSKLQRPCSEPLRTPAEVNAPAFSSAALQQQQPTTNMALSLCLVGDRGLWVGWSSGHIGVYQMHLEHASATTSPSATPSDAKRLKSRSTNWALVSYLHEHRAAVHMVVTGPGPWVFSASHDHRVLQWNAETRQMIRDLTNICRAHDDYRPSPIRMMCVAMGCSSSTSFRHPRGHFVFFFSTERRALYSLALGGPGRTGKVLSDRDVPLQRVTSARPTVTSSAVLIGDDNDDAAAVLCLGDDEGTITFTTLTVVYDGGSATPAAAAAAATSSPITDTAIPDDDYLRAVADAALSADTLNVNRGRVTVLSVLSAVADHTTGIMSYGLAAASSRNVITLFKVSVSPLIAGGHVSGCALLSVLPTGGPVTCLTPLLRPVCQGPVATALTAFADGTTAVLFDFHNLPTRRKDDNNHTVSEVSPLRYSSATTPQRSWSETEVEALQQRLRAALEVVAHASAVAEEADQALEEQQREMRQLRSANDVLASQLQQLSEALSKKNAEVVALKRQKDHAEGEKAAILDITRQLNELERRNQSLVEHLDLLRVEKEDEVRRAKSLETERDRMQAALCEAEERHYLGLDELLRGNRFLAENIGCLEREKRDVRLHAAEERTHVSSAPLPSTVASTKGGGKYSLRELLEQALSALEPAADEAAAS
ncbi:hypothetical protein DQ04_00371020 [Trypanosoma grayi]|uniref:hypothetical protein n=1 Tax=Trypanosoma grayi TaxID=71804 RepID=UPI0004F4525F|nr:hypothetical protein DQ04_00371020 [Trypanosoma grayi]KEG14616.1 hypothetical protein DQ04_00371020 [Trypanosoma grayi]